MEIILQNVLNYDAIMRSDKTRLTVKIVMLQLK